jgi:hypothetical protein
VNFDVSSEVCFVVNNEPLFFNSAMFLLLPVAYQKKVLSQFASRRSMKPCFQYALWLMVTLILLEETILTIMGTDQCNYYYVIRNLYF